MQDRSWMLNAQAIRVAQQCVTQVKSLFGVKMKLSSPDFMQKLHEYVELSKNRELGDSYSELLSFAGVGQTLQNLHTKHSASEPQAAKITASGEYPMVVDSDIKNEFVAHGGKFYPRWKGGKKFTGLYRGNPYYN